MNKKCPPGVICIENVTMFFLFIILLIVGYLIYISLVKQVVINNNNTSEITEPQDSGFGYFTRPNYAYNNLPNDVLMNPYAPPLRDERYFIPELRGRIPINVSTNRGAVDTAYRQVGLLTPLHNSSEKDKILPLMGRPLFVNRDKWQYYSMSDQNNSVKLPVLKNGRSCTNEYGCDVLYNGDTIYVEGYKQAFKVTTYDNDTIKYIPYL